MRELLLNWPAYAGTAVVATMLTLGLVVLVRALPIVQRLGGPKEMRQVEDQYLRALITYIDRLHVQASFDRQLFVERHFRVVSGFESRKFFVSSRRSALSRLDATDPNSASQDDGYYASNLLRETSRRSEPILLLGEPGSGKSVSARQLTREAAIGALRDASASRTIPVFISLSDFGADDVPEFFQFLKGTLGDTGGSSALPSHYLVQHLEDYLDAGRILFVLDGLDELPPATLGPRTKSLDAFMRRRGNCKFIVSCRSGDFLGQLAGVRAHLDKLRPSDIKRFIVKRQPILKAWSTASLYAAITAPTFKLNPVIDNPFYLNLILYYLALTNELPDHFGRLFQTICADWATRELDKERSRTGGSLFDRGERGPDGSAEELLATLAAIAFYISNEAGFGTAIKVDVLANAGSDPILVREALRIGSNGGLIEFDAAKIKCRFVHHKFQEYFAAAHLDYALREGLSDYRALPAICHNIWWDEVTAILAGISSEAGRIVAVLLKHREADSWELPRRFLLIGRCLQTMADVPERQRLLRELLAQISSSWRGGRLFARVDGLRGLAQIDHEDALDLMEMGLRSGNTVLRELAFYGFSRTTRGRAWLNQNVRRVAREALWQARFGSRAGRYVSDAQAVALSSWRATLVFRAYDVAARGARFAGGVVAVAAAIILLAAGRADIYSCGLLALVAMPDSVRALWRRGIPSWKEVRRVVTRRIPIVGAVAAAAWLGAFQPPLWSSLTIFVLVVSWLTAYMVMVLTNRRLGAATRANLNDERKRQLSLMTSELQFGTISCGEFVEQATQVAGLDGVEGLLTDTDLGGRELEVFEALENARRKRLQDTTNPTIVKESPRYSYAAPRGAVAATEPAAEPDVFLSYNTKDAGVVEEFARQFARIGLEPWFDRTHLRAGAIPNHELARVLRRCRAVVVFVGVSGLGAWQDIEVSMALAEFARRRLPIIPLILDGRAAEDLPALLNAFSAVDGRDMHAAIAAIGRAIGRAAAAG